MPSHCYTLASGELAGPCAANLGTVTYRDDHDASIARAAALEEDLERAEADRRRAVAERDGLAAELAKVRSEHTPAVTEIVVAERAPLTRTEVEALVGDLENRALGARLGATAGVGLAFAVAVVMGLAAVWVGTLTMFAVSVAVVVILLINAVVSVMATNPARWRPVLAALRDAPTRIVRVSHRESANNYRVYHYLTIRSDRGSLVVKEPNWTRLYDQLKRHCPGASFEP